MPLAVTHPILTCAEAKAWETNLLRSESDEWQAMHGAGDSLARAVAEDFREIGGLPVDARLLVLVGKGHNGGDALLAAAKLLHGATGGAADVVLAFGREGLRPLARRALDDLLSASGSRTRVVSFVQLRNTVERYDVCLDGIFGFQFRPPMTNDVAELIEWVNVHPRIALRAAVDLPSGLSDQVAGENVFRADFTYCTGIVKTPVVAPENAAHVGRARYLDLGFFASLSAASTASATARGVLTLAPLEPLARLRAAQSDKRTFGQLVIVGGSRDYPGAVLMAVQSALRSGVGLLTACVPEFLVPEYAARFPEAMWVGFKENAAGGLSRDSVGLIVEKATRGTAWLIGPGLGAADETLAAAQEVVRATSLPVVLDADAIRPELVASVAPSRLIATPHAGEWRRVSDTWPHGAVLVAKGTQTRVVSGDMEHFSFFGGPVLARGGSGDLLAGLIAGLLAQAPENLWLAAARGVVWHGRAADLLARDRGQVAVQTTQLLDHLQPALHATDHAP